MSAKKQKDKSVVTRNKGAANKSMVGLDLLKWIVVIAIIVAGAVANAYYASVAWALRAAAWIVVFVLAALVAFYTTQGQFVWGFAKQARSELRKVVWPSRQQATQTTLMVVGLVVLVALVLWGLDTLFLWGVGWLVGQRG